MQYEMRLQKRQTTSVLSSNAVVSKKFTSKERRQKEAEDPMFRPNRSIWSFLFIPSRLLKSSNASSNPPQSFVAAQPRRKPPLRVMTGTFGGTTKRPSERALRFLKVLGVVVGLEGGGIFIAIRDPSVRIAKDRESGRRGQCPSQRLRSRSRPRCRNTAMRERLARSLRPWRPVLRSRSGSRDSQSIWST